MEYTKEGDKLLQQLREASFKRDQARLLLFALRGYEYKPDRIYWHEWKEAVRN